MYILSSSRAFAKRVEKNNRNKKELSVEDAAMMIQITFRVYLIRRSQALRALHELAIAKGKLKELKALFKNPTYHGRLAHDEEERQKFSERIIVLLLTVDATEGVNILVRHAKRSMLDELEAMLDIVDPQSRCVKSLTLKRRTSNMPNGGVIQKEAAEGVTQLKEVKALFNNYSYRRRLTRDKEETQKFSERIIVLLLTVDAIEGDNILVRHAKRPMLDELEAMLDIAFAKIWEKNKVKKKKKELSPQDAARMIQIMFRAYLIRKSMALRALRELAIAKGKLKEVKDLFNIYSYRRRLTRDKEERQKFSERITVLLLTVDATEDANIQVRVAKRQMVDELEAMQEVVNPHPGRDESLSLRTFDIRDGVTQKKMGARVAQVIRMLEYADGSETFG
uniref:Putative IQ motif, EF-hand binding site n=1 Tax=Helianthus annuus TaxID=4232 RepID=A0A251UQB6_HELAN